jgi:hypothetical protein
MPSSTLCRRSPVRKRGSSRVKFGQETEISLDVGETSDCKSARASGMVAPRELRIAEFERGIIARRGLEYLHAGAHDLWSYAIIPYDPDLDHGGPMLATGRGRHPAR